jgi:hypothetical protein
MSHGAQLLSLSSCYQNTNPRLTRAGDTYVDFQRCRDGALDFNDLREAVQALRIIYEFDEAGNLKNPLFRQDAGTNVMEAMNATLRELAMAPSDRVWENADDETVFAPHRVRTPEAITSMALWKLSDRQKLEANMDGAKELVEFFEQREEAGLANPETLKCMIIMRDRHAKLTGIGWDMCGIELTAAYPLKWVEQKDYVPFLQFLADRQSPLTGQALEELGREIQHWINYEYEDKVPGYYLPQVQEMLRDFSERQASFALQAEKTYNKISGLISDKGREIQERIDTAKVHGDRLWDRLGLVPDR